MPRSPISSVSRFRQADSLLDEPTEGPHTPIDFGQNVPGSTQQKPVVYAERSPRGRHTKDPVKTSTYITERLMNPTESIKELAERVGLPRQTAQEIEGRLNTRYAELKEAVEPITQDEIESLLTRRLRHMDGWLTDDRFTRILEQTKGKDYAVMEAIIIDKLMQVRGVPVATISVQQQNKLDQLLPAVMEALKQRGLVPKVIEGTATSA